MPSKNPKTERIIIRLDTVTLEMLKAISGERKKSETIRTLIHEAYEKQTSKKK